MRIAFLLSCFLVLFSCDKDGGSTGTKLNLVFELRYDGELLSKPEQLYALNDSVDMRFSKVSFYLSDFKLTEGIESLPLIDIVHVSFLQDINGDAIQEMQQKLSFEVPPGDYRSLSFGLGLTPTQNATVPSDHEPGSALSLTSEYWTAWDSYVFEKIEGIYKLRELPEEPVTLHAGSNQTYRVLKWNDGLSLKDGGNKKIVIPIDLKYILKNYPITEAPRLHKLEQLPYMEMLADGFSESMNN